MRAMWFETFGGRPVVAEVPDPSPAPDGVVLKVRASGLCRSDWHGWMGHDPDISLPHVSGHELAGEVVALGSEVRLFRQGERVTLPFVCACGACPECAAGEQQVCERQFQPGFTGWGSFAEYVAVRFADGNLVRLPEEIDDVTAASLGCRFSTSFRAVNHQGRLRPGEWLAVHGCGGVGLSAVMIGAAAGGQVVAVDIDDAKLSRARELGARATVNARQVDDVAAAVRELTSGGAHVSIDALGSPATLASSVASLRRRGRHVQVGLLLAAQRQPPVPMDLVVARELRLLGSHGMAAHAYPELLRMVASGALRPQLLVGQRLTLDEAVDALVAMDRFPGVGVSVIDRFGGG